MYVYVYQHQDKREWVEVNIEGIRHFGVCFVYPRSLFVLKKETFEYYFPLNSNIQLVGH